MAHHSAMDRNSRTKYPATAAPLSMPTPLPARVADCCSSALASSTSCRIRVERSVVTSEISSPSDRSPADCDEAVSGGWGCSWGEVTSRAADPVPVPGSGVTSTAETCRQQGSGARPVRRDRRCAGTAAPIPRSGQRLDGVPVDGRSRLADDVAVVAVRGQPAGEPSGEHAGTPPRSPGTAPGRRRANERTSSSTLPGSRSSNHCATPCMRSAACRARSVAGPS